MNCEVDAQTSYPHFNWDSADLMGELKAFRLHAEFMFNGPLREMNEEEKCCYLILLVVEKGRKVFSTCTTTDAEQEVLQNYCDRFQAYVQPESNRTNCTAKSKNQGKHECGQRE